MKYFLMLLVGVAWLSSPVMAQEQDSQDISSLLVPAGAWLVGPTTLADGSAAAGGMPCVMVNKFSNQMEMRLSGGGNEILALALNVGAASFTVDQNYLMNITFDGAAPLALPAQAFSEDTVVVGTEPGKDFYKSLQDKQSMTVQLGESVMEFSLLGVPQGLKRLEECFKPAPVAEAAAGATAPIPNSKADSAGAPVTPSLDAAAPVTPASAAGIQMLDEVSPQKVTALMAEIKGESPAPVSKADADSGSEPAAEPAPVPVAAPKPAPAAQLKSQDILTPGTATAVTGEGQQMRWRVMKGANLQNILEVWAASAQARLIWKSSQTFSVPESLALQGTFEAAVEAVLGQFSGAAARPVGKIYQDPAMKQKVLVIESDHKAESPAGEGAYAPIIAPKL